MNMHDLILQDPVLSDADIRQHIYDGRLLLFSPTKHSLKLVEFARECISNAFGSTDPERAQHFYGVKEFAAILAALKPTFIHHAESKRLVQGILADIGFDSADTYFDVPRMRTATSHDYLTSGIAYAFHPHRDTWYSAAQCQINFWMPIFPISEGNTMAIHPRYWSEPVKNSSRCYNYAEWNRTSRYVAAQQISTDTRTQPKPEQDLELEPSIKLVMPPGGVMVLSAAHMHSTIRNMTGLTRFSIDFRAVNGADAAAFRGAPNIDSECTGTALGDFLRCGDLSHLPSELISKYDTAKPAEI